MIEQIDLLPQLFEIVFLPDVVRDELANPEAPSTVRTWVVRPPSWLTILPTPPAIDDPALRALDDGERAAITLAVTLKAELILMDDRAGVTAARAKGFAVTGTLGLLDLAAGRGLIDLSSALSRLKDTSFHYRQELFESLLKKHKDTGHG